MIALCVSLPSLLFPGLRRTQKLTLHQMSVFLAALDITIVTTALPTISNHFQSASAYVWVGSAFMVTASALTANWGKLSDIWGRKAILLIAVTVFFLGSALCGAANSVAMIIAGRAVQGGGAGGLLALANIIIGDLFSQRLVWAVVLGF